MGSQRINSKLGSSEIYHDTVNPVAPANPHNLAIVPKLSAQNAMIQTRFDLLGVVYRGISQGSAGLITSLAGRIASPQLYFYHPDHLGSSSLITDGTGALTQHIQYVPFGEVFVEERTNSWSTPYKFNGKELDEETGLYYYHARYYDPRLSVWLSVDPLAEKYFWTSSYVYCLNNPVIFIDPDGRSTEVVDNGNGKYTVVGGSLKDKDKGIYVVTQVDGKYVRTGERLGESLTMYSFYNADYWDAKKGMKTGWAGTIDTNSDESRSLVENFKNEAGNISVLYYIANATDGKDYDFKRDGNEKNNDRNFHHRGSKWEMKDDGTQVYATARDAGNFAAGYLAGLKGISWFGARAGFDGLELLKSGHREGEQSTRAQEAGHSVSYPTYMESLNTHRQKLTRTPYPLINQGVVPFR